jgi:zinc/manganese transport system substrate-binding protein
MKTLFALALVLLIGGPARAALKVVASISTLASLAKEVGGDRVSVEALSRGTQDPHFVEPKPSLMLVLNRADLLLHVGMELEIGWLPPLVLGSRNPHIQPGEPGNLDCSQAIDPLDVPTFKVDRSMGDIHPQGNPHYWVPPDNARRIAALIAARLQQLDPEGAHVYGERLRDFEKRVAQKEKQWAPMIEKLRGAKVVTYHKSWSYVSRWLGLVEVGYIEPKPGVPPPPSHLARLVLLMRRDHVQLLLMESFYNRGIAQEVASKAGARLLVLPTDVGARPELKTWFDVAQAVIEELIKGVG